eukprot:comp21026_c0_seq1/m.28237 comp21026_c0_seq1/g.28237  ORF comp21026_c0_seq1/g.28237 comp21026_c0_seq1/m.28237 type:complete len:1182 (-) comp21026_c0_seq1:729-4274(-)
MPENEDPHPELPDLSGRKTTGRFTTTNFVRQQYAPRVSAVSYGRASTASYGGGRASTASYGGARPSMSARPSVALNINEKPGEYVGNLFAEQEDEPEDTSHLMGTFGGVYKPTCLMMWGVIIFLRFGEVVGQAGIGICIATVILSAVCVGLTASSVSALVSNGVPSGQGGVYRLLTRSLGASIGGSFSILYFFGLTVMACVEMVGFTEALHHVLGDQIHRTVSGSVYTDQMIFGMITFFAFWGVMFIGPKLTHPLSMFFLAILLVAYLSSFIGLFASAGGWATGYQYVHLTDTNMLVTGLSTQNFVNNFGPDFTHGYTYSTVLTFIFPCFIGIFRGAGNAHMLKNPSQSMPVGAFGAIATSASLYILIFCLLGAVAPRETLKDHFLLFEKMAWPNQWLSMLGLLMVPLGAGIEYLELAQGILKVIAAEKILPFLSSLRLDWENAWGIPTYALAGSMITAFPFLFIPNLDIIATIVTMLYLLNYTAVNFSCFLLTALGAPSWRPRFRFFHKYFTALPGALLCLVVMFTIQWWAALAATIVFILIAIYIEIRNEAKIWGHGVRGLKMHLALQALVGVEQDETAQLIARLRMDPPSDETLSAGEGETRGREGTEGVEMTDPPVGMENYAPIEDEVEEDPAPWRPHVLVMLRMVEDNGLNSRQHALLDFTRMLTKSSAKGALIIAGNVVLQKDTDRATMLHDKIMRRKAVLQQSMQEHKLSGFAEVVTAPSAELGTSILLQTAGLGCLKPNTVIAAWPDKRQVNIFLATNFVKLIAQARAENKAMLFAKGLDTFPAASFKAQGYLDIWWVVQEGGLLLLVGHLLKQHRTFQKCRMRVFTVASADSNSVAIGNGLKRLLKALRIQAEVHVVELSGQDLQAFAADFTVTKRNSYSAAHTRLGSVFPSCVTELVALGEEAEKEEERERGSNTKRNSEAGGRRVAMVEEGSQEDVDEIIVQVHHPERKQSLTTTADASSAAGSSNTINNNNVAKRRDSGKGGNSKEQLAMTRSEPELAHIKLEDEGTGAVDGKASDAEQVRRTPSGDDSIDVDGDGQRGGDEGGIQAPTKLRGRAAFNASSSSNNTSGGMLNVPTPNMFRSPLSPRAPSVDNPSAESLVWTLPELKEAMEAASSESTLVILNLPVPNRRALSNAEEYISLVDDLTAKLPRCVLAHGLGDGTQVISVFNH